MSPGMEQPYLQSANAQNFAKVRFIATGRNAQQTTGDKAVTSVTFSPLAVVYNILTCTDLFCTNGKD